MSVNDSLWGNLTDEQKSVILARFVTEPEGPEPTVYHGSNGSSNGSHSAAPKSADPNQFRPDDTGNSELFAAMWGENVRYDHAAKKWLVWTGTHWEPDADKEISRMAKETSRSLFQAAADLANLGQDEKAAKLAKWAATSGYESRRNAMLNLASTELPIATNRAKFPDHPLAVNVQNGTLDLDSGELRPHDRADMFTYVLSVDYDPNSAAPRWDRFIDRITGGNAEVSDFLARAVGYTLSGLTGEQCLFFLHGGGSNGKSTFIETITSLMGDLGLKARSQILMEDERGKVPNEIAALAGRRLVVGSELSEGVRLNEGLIKDLTGGDTMSARFLYGESFNFRPAFKVWLYGNHKPIITGTDNGIWRRVKLIPFTVQIPDDEKDASLPDKLRGEMPGILAWAVRGWQSYKRIGLRPPQAVRAATDGYRQESDTLGAFLDERVVKAQGATVTAGELYESYREWAGKNGQYPLANARFSRALAERGIEKYPDRDSKGRAFYLGMGLLSE